ncbi:hypothetical protein [uncultured Parabacteroides sp.]|uniref:hypothetical protein n=1 Tax=uncultured Parabacteroides sp. TaxID=512312 RepID=UPI002599A70A|nr:hypothetical protein [uncultured Parabacteroides sp.]
MEYYGNILCIDATELISSGILTKSHYDQLSARKQINVVNRGCRNTPARVAVESLPSHLYRQVVEVIGDPKKVAPNESWSGNKEK